MYNYDKEINNELMTFIQIERLKNLLTFIPFITNENCYTVLYINGFIRIQSYNQLLYRMLSISTIGIIKSISFHSLHFHS